MDPVANTLRSFHPVTGSQKQWAAGGRGGNERVYAEYSILKLVRLVEKWKFE